MDEHGCLRTHVSSPTETFRASSHVFQNSLLINKFFIVDENNKAHPNFFRLVIIIIIELQLITLNVRKFLVSPLHFAWSKRKPSPWSLQTNLKTKLLRRIHSPKHTLNHIIISTHNITRSLKFKGTCHRQWHAKQAKWPLHLLRVILFTQSG